MRPFRLWAALLCCSCGGAGGPVADRDGDGVPTLASGPSAPPPSTTASAGASAPRYEPVCGRDDCRILPPGGVCGWQLHVSCGSPESLAYPTTWESPWREVVRECSKAPDGSGVCCPRPVCVRTASRDCARCAGGPKGDLLGRPRESWLCDGQEHDVQRFAESRGCDYAGLVARDGAAYHELCCEVAEVAP